MHNQIIVAQLRDWLRLAYHCKETRQWAMLRECRRNIRRWWKYRHLSNEQAIRKAHALGA